MRQFNFSGGEALKTKLQEILDKVGKDNIVKVGFISGALYPDGTPVAMVAALQEYGTSTIPSRPFFRNMIAEKSPNWGKNLGVVMKFTDGDAGKALEIMGMKIGGQLVQSIKDTNDPALSPVTLMLRKMFGNHPEEITGAAVGEAARRVAAGESGASGTQAKPLDWTGLMQNSIRYEVGEHGQAHVPGSGK
jgi:hypothetical protein